MIVAIVSMVILVGFVEFWNRAWAAADQFSREAQEQRAAAFLAQHAGDFRRGDRA